MRAYLQTWCLTAFALCAGTLSFVPTSVHAQASEAEGPKLTRAPELLQSKEPVYPPEALEQRRGAVVIGHVKSLRTGGAANRKRQCGSR